MSTVTDRLGGAKGSLGYKAPCVAASTGNLTLSGAQTVDGVSCVDGDRVLVKDQTTATENGIYVVRTTAWERAKDFDGNDDIVKGTRVAVAGGTIGEAEYKVTTANPITIGTSSIAISASVRDASIGGFNWIYSSTTTAADPGSGYMRFDSTTMASVTAAYIDDSDVYATDVSNWIDSLDASTATNKSVLKVTSRDDPTVFAMFYVTAASDSTGYWTLTLTYVAASGTFTNGEQVSVTASPSGNVGDVTGPGSSTDGYIPQWSGTSGDTLSTGIATTSVLRTTDIGSTGTNGVQAYSTALLQEGSTGSVLSVGFPSTSESLGTLSTAATLTLNLRSGHFQHVTIQAAIAIAPQTDVGTIILEVTNGSTASSITSTAYTITVGAFTQVSGDDFIATSVKTQSFSMLSVQPLQST